MVGNTLSARLEMRRLRMLDRRRPDRCNLGSHTVLEVAEEEKQKRKTHHRHESEQHQQDQGDGRQCLAG